MNRFRMTIARVPIVFSAITLVAAVALFAPASGLAQESSEEWSPHSGQGYFTLVTPDGEEITKTSLGVTVGDQYINEGNRQFQVTDVDRKSFIAHVKFLGTVDLPDVDGLLSQQPSRFGTFVQMAMERLGVAQAPAKTNKGPIGIYHTHSDESYVPTSGTASKDWGDIYKVGETLKKVFEGAGYDVIWSEKNHNPHDGDAYNRSRPTATQILKKRPITVFDVHRDAVPADEYQTTVNGEPMSKVRIVVGRQNPNRPANLEYAKTIKAVADKEFPGLIKGIYDARGNYNQDLGPRMMLLEFGTDKTSLQNAEKAAKVISKVLPAAAGMAPGSGGANRGIGAAAGRTALILLVVGAIAAAAWFFLNKEGWRNLIGNRNGDDGDDNG